MYGFARQGLHWLPAFMAALLLVVVPCGQFHRASHHADMAHAACETGASGASRATNGAHCPAHHEHDPDCALCATIDVAGSLVLPPLAAQTAIILAETTRHVNPSDGTKPTFAPSRYRARAPPPRAHT